MGMRLGDTMLGVLGIPVAPGASGTLFAPPHRCREFLPRRRGGGRPEPGGGCMAPSPSGRELDGKVHDVVTRSRGAGKRAALGAGGSGGRRRESRSREKASP